MQPIIIIIVIFAFKTIFSSQTLIKSHINTMRGQLVYALKVLKPPSRSFYNPLLLLFWTLLLVFNETEALLIRFIDGLMKYTDYCSAFALVQGYYSRAKQWALSRVLGLLQVTTSWSWLYKATDSMKHVIALRQSLLLLWSESILERVIAVHC